MPPDRFWSITPRELRADLDGARRRQDGEIDKIMLLAWQTANLHRADKLPPLQDLLAKSSPAPPPEQGAASLEASIDQLFIALGGNPADLSELRQVSE